MKLEKNCTAKERSEFMVRVRREGLKVQRTEDGGWETCEELRIKNEELRVKDLEEKTLRSEMTLRNEGTIETVGTLETLDTVETGAPKEEQPEQPAKKGFWKRLKSVIQNSKFKIQNYHDSNTSDAEL
jgi:hypothetical protein